jgi:hypothetical protein
MEMWIGCVAGALEEREFRALLDESGFEDVEIEPTRVYGIDDARAFLTGAGIDVDAVAPLVQDRFISAFVRGRKPAAETDAPAADGAEACCEPGCCA